MLSFFLTVPLLLDLTGSAGMSRAAGVGLFADTGPFWRINEQRGEHEQLDSKIARVLHNKATNYSLAFLQNYTEHFWGEFLFCFCCFFKSFLGLYDCNGLFKPYSF